MTAKEAQVHQPEWGDGFGLHLTQPQPPHCRGFLPPGIWLLSGLPGAVTLGGAGLFHRLEGNAAPKPLGHLQKAMLAAQL